MSKRLNLNDNFDELLFRHDYLRKVKNFDESRLKKYDKTINITNDFMYKKHKECLNSVGLYRDDSRSLVSMFTMYYLALYSFEKDPKNEKRWIDWFVKNKKRQPTSFDYKKYNENNIINFVRQRFDRVRLVCESKSQNIVCDYKKQLHLAKTKDSINTTKDALFDNYKKYGYRKVGAREFKEIIDRAADKRTLTDKDGFAVFTINKTTQPPLSVEDMVDKSEGDVKDFYSMYCVDGTNSDVFNFDEYRDVELKVIEDQKNREFQGLKDNFNSLSIKDKRKQIRVFIEKNKDNPNLSDSVSLARKFIKIRGFLENCGNI